MRDEQKRNELPAENALVNMPAVTMEGSAAEYKMRHMLSWEMLSTGPQAFYVGVLDRNYEWRLRNSR
jgi:hypothetical protein